MIYLDNAATTKPSETALLKAQTFLTENYFNPSAMYREGFALQSDLKKARSVLLSFVGAGEDFEWIFTSCGTESDNQAVFGIAKRGNAVTTAGEHSAVYAPFQELKLRGLETRVAPLLSDGRVDMEQLLSLVDEKTTLVSVIHVNNETGAINDINAIAKAVKAKNPRVVFHSDGVQAFGKIPYRISKDVDLYSVSAHKIGGLKGVGGLIKRKSLALPAYLYGGGQENGKRSGTENVFGIKTLEYAASEKYENLRENFTYVKSLKETMAQGLDPAVYSLVSGENSSPYILSVSAKGLRGAILQRQANDEGLLVGTGSACSSNAKTRYSRVILACGYDERTADGFLRISFSAETTKDEVCIAVEILNRIAKNSKY